MAWEDTTQEMLDFIIESMDEDDSIDWRYITCRLMDEAYGPFGSHWFLTFPLNNTRSVEFGDSPIKFGKYAGRRVDDVPIEYLEFLAGRRDWYINLNRYLASERIRKQATEAAGAIRSRRGS